MTRLRQIRYNQLADDANSFWIKQKKVEGKRTPVERAIFTLRSTHTAMLLKFIGVMNILNERKSAWALSNKIWSEHHGRLINRNDFSHGTRSRTDGMTVLVPGVQKNEIYLIKDHYLNGNFVDDDGLKFFFPMTLNKSSILPGKKPSGEWKFLLSNF